MTESPRRPEPPFLYNGLVSPFGPVLNSIHSSLLQITNSKCCPCQAGGGHGGEGVARGVTHRH